MIIDLTQPTTQSFTCPDVIREVCEMAVKYFPWGGSRFNVGGFILAWKAHCKKLWPNGVPDWAEHDYISPENLRLLFRNRSDVEILEGGCHFGLKERCDDN